MRTDFLQQRKTGVIAAITSGLFLLFFISSATAGQQAPSSSTLRSMARLYMAYGNYDKARVFAETALTTAKKQNLLDEEMAMCLIDLGTVYGYQDMLEDATRMLSRGIALQKSAVGNHPYVAYTLQMLSDIYRRQGQYHNAERTLADAFAIMKKFHSDQASEMLSFKASQAKLMMDKGQITEAKALYTDILDKTIASYGRNHLQTATVLSGLAEAETLQGEFDSACLRIDQALRIQEKYFSTNPQLLIPVWLTKARIERAAGNKAEAEVYLSKAAQTTQLQNNVIATARIYEKINAIRTETTYVAMN